MSIEALSGLARAEAAHWYRLDTGEPAYDADLRRARKERLVPSTTGILKLWPKPALAKYLRQQDLLAAITLPRLPGEGDDAFCARVIEDAGKHAGAAAEFGTEIHGIFESILNESPMLKISERATAWVQPIVLWCHENVQGVSWIERYCVSALYGYGCRADALLELRGVGQCIVDAKTQGVKNGKPVFYDEWAMQLSANRRAAGVGGAAASILIDSTTPSAPILKVWTEDELDEGWLDFLACFELWKRSKRYDPLKGNL